MLSSVVKIRFHFYEGRLGWVVLRFGGVCLSRLQFFAGQGVVLVENFLGGCLDCPNKAFWWGLSRKNEQNGGKAEVVKVVFAGF